MSINDKKRLLDYIYRSRGNILDMLETRKYDTKKYKNYSYDILTSLYDKHEQGKYSTLPELSPLDIEVKSKSGNERIIIKYRLDEKFKNTGALKKLVNIIYDEHNLTDHDTLILFVVNAILPKPNNFDNPSFNFCEEFRIQNRFVQVFGLENLLINISKHSFVPKHTILNDNEVANICEKYNTSPDKLLKIHIQDPMAKFIGLRPGQVVKIDSYDAVTGHNTFYRVCII